MQVDLEGLTRSMRERLSKLEEQESRLEEGLLAVQVMEYLRREPETVEIDPPPHRKHGDALADLQKFANEKWQLRGRVA